MSDIDVKQKFGTRKIVSLTSMDKTLREYAVVNMSVEIAATLSKAVWDYLNEHPEVDVVDFRAEAVIGNMRFGGDDDRDTSDADEDSGA